MKLIWTHHWPFSYLSNLGLRMGGVGGDVVNETLTKINLLRTGPIKKKFLELYSISIL